MAALLVVALCISILLPSQQVGAFLTPSSAALVRRTGVVGADRSLFLSAPDDGSSGVVKREANGMPILPSNVVRYSTVPNKPDTKYFKIDSIPSGLLKKHSTKEGTWGVIRVNKGKLEYNILEPEESVHILDAENVGVIEPTRLHQVKGLSDDLEFVVEFCRVPGTGNVDEKREGLDE